MFMLVYFGALIVMILAGFPIAVAMAICAIGFFFGSGNTDLLIMLPQYYYKGFTDSTFMAIPFFILAGDLMSEGDFTKDLTDLIQIFFGRVKGSLAYVVTVACMAFGAICGSGPATAACIGGSMAPQMEKEKYDPAFTAGLIGVAGPLGVLIPPSIQAIVMSGVTNISVQKLFLSTVPTAFIYGVMIIAWSRIVVGKKGYGIVREKREGNIFVIFGKQFITSLPMLIAPVIILGGIYSGLFTPTESAVVCVNYTLLLIFIKRRMTMKRLIEVMLKACINAGAIVGIIGASQVFGYVLTYTNVHHTLANFIAQSNSLIFFMLLTQLVFFLGGMLIAGSSEIMLLMPILFPIATALGIDPLYYCGVVLVNLAIGMMTPPMANTMFVSARVCNVPFDAAIKASIPIIAILVVCAVGITFMPAITTWLPNLVMGAAN